MSIINNPKIRCLWEDAQTKPEWATTRLWEYVFRTQVFKGENWAISSQQPPTDAEGDRRRVDLVAEHSDESGTWKRVLFIEAKTATAGPDELKTAECQAFMASYAYLHHFRKDRVCAMTCFGGKARLWTYERGEDYLTPYVPAHGDGIGAKDEYIEANSKDGHIILEALKFIRDHHVPATKTLLS